MLYFSTTTTLERQALRRSGRFAAVRALEQLRRDLVSAAPATDEERGCGFALRPPSPGGPPFAEVALCTATRGDADLEDPDYHLHEVRYRVAQDARNRPVLERLEQPRAGPGALTPPRVAPLLPGVTLFQVAFRDGDQWRTAWTEDLSERTPSAARIELGYGHPENPEKVLRVEVAIPAGIRVESGLERGAP